MRKFILTVTLIFFAPLALLAQESPSEWIDPATGHKVIRLSREAGTASLYFHQNGYTVSGDKLVVTNPQGIATIDLKTGKIEQIVVGAFQHRTEWQALCR